MSDFLLIGVDDDDAAWTRGVLQANFPEATVTQIDTAPEGGPFCISGDVAVELPGLDHALTAFKRYNELVALIAAALYEEPYTYCEACKGIGSDENTCFWCSPCKGEGWIVDTDEVPVHREVAELEAQAVVAALLNEGGWLA